MYRRIYLLFAVIVSCNIAYAQMESKTNRNDSTLLCNECDSLYNRICPNESGSYGFVENPPLFPGGEKEMMKFLVENLQYPAEYVEMCFHGRVIVRFIVSETGRIICPKIQRSLHPVIDEEALRVVRLMPNFVPASTNGIPVKMCYTLPVPFRL
jgi:TonB family protein